LQPTSYEDEHSDEEKTARTVSVLVVGPAARMLAVPEVNGVHEKTTSGFPVVEPQLNGVWSATRPVNVKLRVPPLAEMLVGEEQLSPPPGGGVSGTQLPLVEQV
jgi:hypothetical protein